MTPNSFQYLKTKYPFIYLWHKSTGSTISYIHHVMEKAEEENAPRNAIYCCGDYGHDARGWSTTTTCQNLDKIKEMITMALNEGLMPIDQGGSHD